MVAGATFGGSPSGGIICRVCLWVLLLSQSSLALAEASLVSSSTISTRLTSVASGDEQPQDLGAYALPRRDQSEGDPLEDNVEEVGQNADDAGDVTNLQIELAEVVGDYALDKKAKLVLEMKRASRKSATGLVWVLVCLALFEVLYQSYVKPASWELQKSYMQMHPGREPKPLSLMEILLTSPIAAAIATAIMVAMVMVITDLYKNLYIGHARTMDLNTFLEEEALKEQEKAAKKKAAQSGSTADRANVTEDGAAVSNHSP